MCKVIEAHTVSTATTRATLTKLRQTFSFTWFPTPLFQTTGVVSRDRSLSNSAALTASNMRRSSPYRTSSNGAAKRACQTVKFGLRKTMGTLKDRKSTCGVHAQNTATDPLLSATIDHQYRTTFCRNKRTINSGI